MSRLLAAIDRDISLSQTDKSEKRARVKQIFKNRILYSDSVQYTIPKVALSRNTIRIPNPLHQGALAKSIVDNYTDIQAIFNSSPLSITKPKIETENGEGKRAITHDNYDRTEIQKRLSTSDNLIKDLIKEVEKLEQQQTRFEMKKIFFVLGKRLDELNELTNKEMEHQGKEEEDLLFDPEYE